jgi:hypothetical protein
MRAEKNLKFSLFDGRCGKSHQINSDNRAARCEQQIYDIPNHGLCAPEYDE